MTTLYISCLHFAFERTTPYFLVYNPAFLSLFSSLSLRLHHTHSADPDTAQQNNKSPYKRLFSVLQTSNRDDDSL